MSIRLLTVTNSACVHWYTLSWCVCDTYTPHVRYLEAFSYTNDWPLATNVLRILGLWHKWELVWSLAYTYVYIHNDWACDQVCGEFHTTSRKSVSPYVDKWHHICCIYLWYHCCVVGNHWKVDVVLSIAWRTALALLDGYSHLGAIYTSLQVVQTIHTSVVQELIVMALIAVHHSVSTCAHYTYRAHYTNHVPDITQKKKVWLYSYIKQDKLDHPMCQVICHTQVVI